MDFFVLTELMENDDIILKAGLGFASAVLQTNIDDMGVFNVYSRISSKMSNCVENFYENVVLQYSNEEFQKHFRMKRTTMLKLINHLKKYITPQKLLHMIIPFDKKVHITVWMLAHQCSFREVGNLFGLCKSSVNFVFFEICELITNERQSFIKWPNEEESETISNCVYSLYSFPNCVGFIDGCHIKIKAPSHNNVDFLKRKQSRSIVLQAVCDHTLKFTDIYIGHTGRAHDARIFRESPLCDRIQELIDTDKHILGDSAYTLSTSLLTPFSYNSHLTPVEIIFNKKHAAARSCIERAFRRLRGKFQRLKYLEMNKTEDISIVICAACVLHNFIIINEENLDVNNEQYQFVIPEAVLNNPINKQIFISQNLLN